eukprot:2612041-Pyramimonas_sp.AAC.1
MDTDCACAVVSHIQWRKKCGRWCDARAAMLTARAKVLDCPRLAHGSAFHSVQQCSAARSSSQLNPCWAALAGADKRG